LFLTAVAASTSNALIAPAVTDRIAIVAEHVARGESSRPGPMLAGLAAARSEIAAAILRGFVKGWPRDRKVELTPDIEHALSTLFDKLPAAAKAQVAALAVRWGSQQLGQQIAAMIAAFYETASKPDLSEPIALAAATQFVDLQKVTPPPPSCSISSRPKPRPSWLAAWSMRWAIAKRSPSASPSPTGCHSSRPPSAKTPSAS